MKILFAGTPDVAAQVLVGIVSAGHEVALVLTREDSPIGRNRVLTPSAVAIAAEKLSLSILKTNDPGPSDIDMIMKSGAALGIVVAYGTILKASALSSLSLGWYNLHFSLLPRYRGAAPVQRTIMAGESETGVTLFQLEKGMDTGPIVGQVHTLINPRENSGELLDRLGQISIGMLAELLPSLYSGTFTLQDQVGEPSFAPKPTRAEAKIDFGRNALAIQHQVLGLNPEPMAWCLAEDEPMRILDALETRSAVVLDALGAGEPGAIGVFEGRVFVHCGSNTLLELLQVQPSSKRVMPAKDWHNGNRGIGNLL